MITILIGMLVNLLTWIIKKTKLSATYVSIILSFLGWIIYFYFTEFNPDWLETLMYYITWIYASSQIIYNLLKKNKIID